jgi:hypothetical protein
MWECVFQVYSLDVLLADKDFHIDSGMALLADTLKCSWSLFPSNDPMPTSVKQLLKT